MKNRGKLRKTMGILNSSMGSFDIDTFKYRKLHHIVAIDTEKTLQAGYTGLDMKRGQLMTIKVKGTGTYMNIFAVFRVRVVCVCPCGLRFFTASIAILP